jgi:hypothetical protein
MSCGIHFENCSQEFRDILYLGEGCDKHEGQGMRVLRNLCVIIFSKKGSVRFSAVLFPYG